MPTDFSKYKAKSTGLTLKGHTDDVLNAGRKLVETLSLTENERRIWIDKIERLAVLHDLGKVHKIFQNSLFGKNELPIRHEIFSFWFCENFLELADDELFAIATHHKGVRTGIVEDDKKRLTKVQLKDHFEQLFEIDTEILKKSFLIDWLNEYGLVLKIQENENFKIPISERWWKLILDKDCQAKEFDKIQRWELAKTRGLLMAADHIGSARIKPEDIPTPKLLQLYDFQPKKDGVLYPFRQFQTDLQTWKGDVILHAPTGSGKTEAALSWIYANQTPNARIFYTLPYTASINAMVVRLKQIYGEDKELVTALHSKSLDFFYDEAEEETSNYEEREEIAKNKRSFSKELFYPVKVTTLHQILKNALMGKGWDIALSDYKNALFIFDEFHTYDPLITGMMMAIVNWLRDNFNAKIMFMSATIPKFILDKLVKCSFGNNQEIIKRPNPNVISDAQVLDRKRHKLICMPQKQIKDEHELIEKIIESGRSVLIIVNNVATCQKLFDDFNHFNPTLLHGGLHRRDRKINEKKITAPNKENRPKLLIATQAVEVSLDIDYEVAFIENAPIDALIQRLGRVNRAGNMKECAEVYIFEEPIGDIKRIYDLDICKNTFKELSKLNDQELTESDLVKICDTVYADGYMGDDLKNFKIGYENPTINHFNEKLVAGHWENWVEQALENSNSKIDVLCGNLFSDYVEFLKKGRNIDAYQLFVQIYFWESKEVQRAISCRKEHKAKNQKYNILIADDLEYKPGFGFKKKANSENQFL
jgi:CRISPR-associated endonuclease/helicase Cas3